MSGRLSAGLEPCLARCVECALQRVVERSQPDLVAGPQGSTGGDEVRAGAPLLVSDDRAQNAVDRGVQGLDDGMVLVEAAAMHLDDDLWARPLERIALQGLQRVAADLAVEAARPGKPFMGGERRLMRRPP